MRVTDKDISFMKRALSLAAKARGMTSPNPMVGALVVKNGKIISEDYHKKAGEPHAEALAILSAGDKAKGAILYVTLEPCCHHGRTPPCSEALIAAGVRRVVTALTDPDPRVSGQGHAALRAAGIGVTEGVLSAEAARLNAGFLKRVTQGLPLVTLKLATTLDGRIATATGDVFAGLWYPVVFGIIGIVTCLFLFPETKGRPLN